MAQPLMHDVVRDLVVALSPPDPVVEFGSLQVEPAQDGDLRRLFAGRSFIGTDMRPGPGVDRVEDLRALSLADASVGFALCIDTLEHCEDPPLACRELARVTAPGGCCVISSVMLFGIHGYPNDYFRFTPEGMRSLLAQGFDHVSACGIGDPDMPYAVLAVGVKAPATLAAGSTLAALPTLAAAQQRFEAAAGRVRVGALRVPPGELLRSLARDAPRLARERLAQVARRSRR